MQNQCKTKEQRAKNKDQRLKIKDKRTKSKDKRYAQFQEIGYLGKIDGFSY